MRPSYARGSDPSRIETPACLTTYQVDVLRALLERSLDCFAHLKMSSSEVGVSQGRACALLDRAHLGGIRGRSLVDLLHSVGHNISSRSQQTVQVGRRRTAAPEAIFRRKR